DHARWRRVPCRLRWRCCLMPDARHAELLPFVLNGEIEFEVAVFPGIRRQLVRANVDLAPLESLPDVPDREEARAPGWEMVVLAFWLAQPLTPDPVVGNFSMAVRARHVELTHLARAQLLASLDGCLRLRARGVDLDGRAIGKEMQIDRHRPVFFGFHRPTGTGGGFCVACDKLFHAQDLVHPGLPHWH